MRLGSTNSPLCHLRPIDEAEGESSRAELVYRRIIQAIQGGLLRPGQRMREVELAEVLNVSRTPIREAMRRLSSEGLVVLGPSRGLMVVELDQQEVQELYALRGTLEGSAARLAAQHASDNEVAFFGRLLDDLDRATTPEAAARSNRTFHQAILSSARNRYLARSLTQLSTSLALLPGTTFQLPGRQQAANDEHREVVRAIERRDPDAAEAAAREHIRRSGIARLDIMFESSLQSGKEND